MFSYLFYLWRCVMGGSGLVVIDVDRVGDVGFIRVVYGGVVHSASWCLVEEVNGPPRPLENVVGDLCMLEAGMLAWDGSSHVELSYGELVVKGAGWLGVGD